jgi:hypothetical protein
MEISKEKPITIVMGSDRRVQGIQTDHFSVMFNGLTNDDYKTILAPLGIKLMFVLGADEPVSGIIEGEKE